jgi:RNA polymerase sigma-70 factor (ECF subfamily)
MKDSEDQILVRKCLDGQISAFKEIINRYQKTIFNIVFRMVNNFDDAHEVTQSVFVKVYENLARYNDKYKFYSWIYRIAVNESINFIKRNSKVQEFSEDYQSDDKDPDEQIQETELQKVISVSLSELNPDFRIIVVLRHFLDYSYRDISNTLGIPENTVKSRLYSARQILAESLIKKGIHINE